MLPRSRLRLEPNIRTKRDAQVVMRAVVEINIIADVQAQPDRAEMAFEAATGIEQAVDVSGAETFDSAGEGVERGWTIVKSKIHESTFYGDEGMYGEMANF